MERGDDEPYQGTGAESGPEGYGLGYHHFSYHPVQRGGFSRVQ